MFELRTNMEDNADVVKLFYQNCASGSHFVGHSMGGYVALALLNYPDTIKLVLLNSYKSR
jgi:pimeloyl-ACP methyl ester carboxylesterase